MYKIDYRSSAKRDLKKFDRNVKEFLKKEIESLQEGFDGKDIEPLKGKNFEGLYRFRTGDYRIIFDKFDDVLIISIVKVAHRREVYKKLKH